MKTFLPFATLLCACAASATEWHVLGPRAMGMGGAGVALPQGAQSGYWNPASLGLADNPSGLQIPIGAHMGITGTVLRGANDLNQVAKDCAAGGAGSGTCSDANVQSAINLMNNPDNGVRADIGGGAGFKVGRLALFANNFTFMGGKPSVQFDTNNLAATVNANVSQLQLRGISLTEIGAAYGRELPFAPGLFAGGALKGMIGRVGYQNISVVTDDPGSGGLDKFSRGSVSSFQPGVDLGLLWDINRTMGGEWLRPRIGLTARNINNPRFKNTDAARAAGMPAKYSVHGAVRMGVAISPLRFWNIAADADLTRNLTAVEGVKSQTVGLGTEVNVFNRTWLNIPLRAGLSKNVAMAGSKIGLSAGAGLNFLHLNFDFGVMVTPGRETVQSQGQSKKIPSEVAASGQFAVLFGGGAQPKAQAD